MSTVSDFIPENMARTGCPAWCTVSHGDQLILTADGTRVHRSPGRDVRDETMQPQCVALELVERADWRGEVVVDVAGARFDLNGGTALLVALAEMLEPLLAESVPELRQT